MRIFIFVTVSDYSDWSPMGTPIGSPIGILGSECILAEKGKGNKEENSRCRHFCVKQEFYRITYVIYRNKSEIPYQTCLHRSQWEAFCLTPLSDRQRPVRNDEAGVRSIAKSK